MATTLSLEEIDAQESRTLSLGEIDEQEGRALSLDEIDAMEGAGPAAPEQPATLPQVPVGADQFGRDSGFDETNPEFISQAQRDARLARTRTLEGPGEGGNAAGRIVGAMVGGAIQAIDPQRGLGESEWLEEDIDELRDMGIFNAPEDMGQVGPATTARDLLEGTVRATSGTLDFVTRAVDVPFRVVTEGIVQGAREMGVSASSADQLRRDIEAITFASGMVLGAAAPSQVPRAGAAQRNYAHRRVERAVDEATEGMDEVQRASMRERAVDEFDAGYDNAMRAAIDEKMGAPTAVEIAESSYRTQYGSAVRNATERIRTEIIDGFDPVRRTEEVARSLGLPDELQPYRELRLLAGSGGAIQAVQRRGTLRWNDRGDIEFSGEGLLDVFRDVADDIPEVQRYFAGRRAQELQERGIRTPFTNDEIQWMVGRGALRPELEQVFDRYQEFNQRTLDFAVQSGYISTETRDALIANGAAYVPFYRVMDAAPSGGRGSGGSPLMSIIGSERNVDEIMENINRNAIMWTQRSLENQAKLHLYDTIDFMAARGVTGIARRIDDIPEEVFVAERQVRDALAQAGLSDDGLIQAFAPSRLRDLRVNGNPVEVVYRDGVRELWEIQDPLMARAIQHVNPESLGPVARWLGAGPAAVLRGGVTLSPDFMIRNMLRDTETAFIQSGGNFVPVGSTARGAITRMREGDDYWAAMVNGAGFGSFYQTEFRLAGTAEDFYRRHGIDYQTQVLNTPQKITRFMTSIPRRLGRAIEEGASVTEQSSRMREFQILRNRGMTDRDAALGGRNVSTDFGVRGASRTMRAWTAVTPFLNARIQGFDRMARVIGEDPGKVMLRGFLSQTVPAVGLYQMNRDDPNYWALPEWVRDQHFVYIDYDDDGGHTTYLIPKAFEYGTIFATNPERMAQAIEQQHGRSFADFWLRTIMDTAAVDVPQVVAPVRDIMNNRTFTGAPIVPADLEDVRASDQFRPGQTSETMVALAQAMREETGVEISPMQAESLLRGYTGTLGMYALSMADWITRSADPDSGEAPDARLDEVAVIRSFLREDDGTRGNQYVVDFYDLVNQSREQAAVHALMTSGMRPDATFTEREEWLVAMSPVVNQVSRHLATLRGAQRRILTDPEISGEEKRRRIDELQQGISDIAYQFMGGQHAQNEEELREWRNRLQALGVYTPPGEVEE